ncbi:MAG TPA: alpha/beta fold hydrolase [Candidatus Saccharimonadales bacterium]|nr:alpha/beta fold hydrolase [Candidatus Saccharimonadales bacterium]
MDFLKTTDFKLAFYAQGDENAENLALVLPGRLDTKDYVHMHSAVDMLASKGFYAISIDPPFSWESPGNTDNYSTTNYLKAVNELIDQIDKPTLLMGHSRGGATSMLASANPRVKALALIMASYGRTTDPAPREVVNNYAISYRDLPPGGARTAEKKKFMLPLSYFEDSRQYDPAGQLAQFKGPKLLVCATHDEFVKPEKVREVYDSLPEPKMFLELDTEHDYRLHADMVEAVNNKVAKFVDKYL